MFGRVRASPSSLDTLDGSPSKILKDDSFSVYEATLMKLKLGARLDNLSASSKEIDAIMDDSSASSSCVEEANVNPNCTPEISASASGSHIVVTASPGDEVTMMETDCSSVITSPSSSDHVSSAGNSEQQRHNDVSILRFFKLKDLGNSNVWSSCGEVASTKGSNSGSVLSSTVESHHCRSETESVQSFGGL